MDEPTRRAWSKPELIVLVRSRPEEAVLINCKGDSVEGVHLSVTHCQAYKLTGCADSCTTLAQS